MKKPEKVVYTGRRAVALLLGGVSHSMPATVQGVYEIWIRDEYGLEAERRTLLEWADRLSLCGSSDVAILPLYNIGDVRTSLRPNVSIIKQKVFPKKPIPRLSVSSVAFEAAIALASGTPGPPLGGSTSVPSSVP